MKRILPFVAAGICLIGLSLVWNALEAEALPPPSAGAVAPAIQEQPAPTNTPAAPEEDIQSTIYEALPPLAVVGTPEQTQAEAIVAEQPIEIEDEHGDEDEAHVQWAYQHAQALRQAGIRFSTNPLPAPPINTPAAPEGDIQSTVYEASSSLPVAGMTEQAQAEVIVAEQPIETKIEIEDEAHVQWAYQHAQALRQAGVRFRVLNPGVRVTGSTSPRSPSETCMNMLWNPQMDVVEFGDGTGSIEYWSILDQKVYYSTVDYNSASYSLAMVDETDGSDTDLVDASTDCDAFGQGFQAPGRLTFLQASYSRLYANENEIDAAFYVLWMLDSQGYLDETVAYWSIGAGTGWSDRQSEPLSSSDLAQVSGKPLALVFYLISNRTSPSEIVWLDDVQVTACYELGANAVYIPLTTRQFGTGEPETITCNPYEPDSVTQRGSSTVGATCDGSFSAMDMQDYYSLSNPNSVEKVWLQFTNLPSGTNWDALIYEDKGGGTYELLCYTGETPGDQDKSVKCTLDVSKTYFVMVNAGTAPGIGDNTYQVSVVQR